MPMEEVERRHIEIHNARGVYSIPMAEFALAGVLDLYKDMARFREQQKRHEWVKNRNIRELAGSRVVIVGCGSVGTECAKRFKAFNCQVIGIDITVRDDGNYDAIKELKEIKTEAAKADIMVLALPLTMETSRLVDDGVFDSFKGILVNIARGGIVDQNALESWKGAAVLDVFEEEPLVEESPLWEKEDTVVTPHNSFVGNGNGVRLSNCILADLEEFSELRNR